jgi:hypothetical protein
MGFENERIDAVSYQPAPNFLGLPMGSSQFYNSDSRRPEHLSNCTLTSVRPF